MQPEQCSNQGASAHPHENGQDEEHVGRDTQDGEARGEDRLQSYPQDQKEGQTQHLRQSAPGSVHCHRPPVPCRTPVDRCLLSVPSRCGGLVRTMTSSRDRTSTKACTSMVL